MNDEIRKHLDDLHSQLEEIDDAPAENLKQATVNYVDETTDDDPEFIERLRESALEFEVSHPELSTFMSRIVDMLTAAGL